MCDDNSRKLDIAELDRMLDPARRYIRSHLGGVEVESIDAHGRVRIRFLGACAGCPSQPLTLVATVAPLLEHVDGVTDVVSDAHISKAAKERIRKYFVHPIVPLSPATAV